MATKIKWIFILFLLSVFNSGLWAQDAELTKAQMYEDFDSLLSVIEYNNPHLGIYKKAMHFDVIEKIKELRPEIENIQNLAGYYMLLRLGFNLIPEIHANVLALNKEALKEYADSSQYNPVIISPANYQSTIDNYNKIAEEADEFYNRYFNPYQMISLPINYINGNYFFSRPVKIINHRDSVLYHVGDKIIRLNGKSTIEFINENHKKYFDRLRWDIYNHNFYTDCLLWVTFFPQSSFAFTDITVERKDGKQETLPLNPDTRFDVLSDNVLKKQPQELVRYDKKPVIWCKDSLLYIKIPLMNPDDLDFYETEIPRVCRDKKIANVVLDVRRNGGGSDKVWDRILSLLTDTPLFRNQIIGVSNPTICRQYVTQNTDSLSTFYDRFLDKQYIIIADESWIAAEPDTNSINCPGKIYVLHDEYTYSAANSLVTFALGSDKLVAVGVPTGYLSGYGVDPFVFQLPISKLLFRMHSVIQFPKNAPSIESYLWNQTEIKIDQSILYSNILAEYRQYDFLYQYEFLNEYDPYFQTVMNDISKK